MIIYGKTFYGPVTIPAWQLESGEIKFINCRFYPAKALNGGGE